LTSDPELITFLKDFIEPWYVSLRNPKASQESALLNLLQKYKVTEYGENFHADKISSVQEFQSAFPIASYDSLQPYIEKVRSGNYKSLLCEPAASWVMTRGTTGKPKVIPTTEEHLSQILFVGARAIINFALNNDPRVIQKNVLNLNFPSEVFTMATDKGEEKYGYSSGTYAKLHPSLETASLVPRQEDIDALGGGITRTDWKRRFELVYSKAKTSDVGCIMGVTPVILAFARYVRKKHAVLPKQIWKMVALFCTSVAKIQTKYAPELKYYYGDVPIVEMYSATEGVFGQQLDHNPYVCFNHDVYFFEVKQGSKVRQLHDLRPNEWGNLIVSSVLFPRYEIGDLVESVGKGYYRIFGRDTRFTKLEHLIFDLLNGKPRLGP
jgi:hypothetical protein